MSAGDNGASRPRPHVVHGTAFDVRWRCFAERTPEAFVGYDRPLLKTVVAHDGRLQITPIMITYRVFIIMSRYLKSSAGRDRLDVGYEPNSLRRTSAGKAKHSARREHRHRANTKASIYRAEAAGGVRGGQGSPPRFALDVKWRWMTEPRAGRPRL